MLEKVTTHALTITHEGFTGTSASFVVSRTGEDVQGVDIVLTDAVPDHGPTGWVESPANGHRYKSVEAGSWFECHLAAIAMGAHIVTIADAAEQRWLLDTFGADEPYWIGLTDEPVEGAWRWVTGEPLVYTNWGDGEPNDAHTGGEDYAHMNWEGARPGSGGWRDLGYTGPDWYTVRKAILETGAIGGRETAPGYER